MLSEFVSEHREAIIERCRARVASRMAPRPTEIELEHGIPLFLDELAAKLRSNRGDPQVAADSAAVKTATTHGGSLLRRGFTVGQVVHDYGDVCQTITEMAIDLKEPITTEEFQTLNMSLDNAISDAVSEFGRQQEIDVVAANDRATEDLGFFAHELRNLIATATLACEALRSGHVGISGSTGGVLERSLKGLRDLVDRSLSIVRLDAGVTSREQISVRQLIQDIEVSAMMEAKARDHQLSFEVHDDSAVLEGDRQIIASVLTNLLQNAYKFSRARSHVVLRTRATVDRVLIEVEDECGGLTPGASETLFKPFTQDRGNRSGLGLGLAICRRGVEAMGGTIHVRDLSGHGCVFTVELPRCRSRDAASS